MLCFPANAVSKDFMPANPPMDTRLSERIWLFYVLSGLPVNNRPVLDFQKTNVVPQTESFFGNPTAQRAAAAR